VTGGCGYIGSQLVPHLLAEGHKVVVFDPQFFGDGHPAHNPNLTLVKETSVPVESVLASDAVIHLASISNNDMYARNETLTMAMNRTLPEIGPRFIYASSVAAYGTSEEVLTEDMPLKPTTPYGEDKAYCEEQVLRKGGVVVRSASVCGHSQNMRFDTTVNRMFKDGLKGSITVNGGSQKRCHVHIQDLCRFYKLLLNTPEHMIRGQAFNVVESNQSVSYTADVVSDHLECSVKTGPATDDRSYMVSGAKAMTILDFVPKMTVDLAVHFMKAHYRNGAYKDMASLGKQRLM